jgi:hypothetical protein
MTAGLEQLRDRRLLGMGLLLGLVILVAFGLVSAIIPSPVFGRTIAPEPFAIVTWIVSAPLAGVLAATYFVRPPAQDATPLAATGQAADSSGSAANGSTLGTVGGIGVFLAIGCPVCNKLALVLLGTSGALTVFAPIQPIIGAASVALLGATLMWRLRRRADGDACAVQAAA